ncbi:hypothetical protein KKD62_03350 [Patescibacteria group bacterium]|nr:hypothetical protein [Patescibacteria group bacterium]MBU1931323.1 hypothetical protein [Patescibacteria group bacterium]
MVFLNDYQKLVRSSPRPPHFSTANENSPHVNSIHYVKNAYYCFDGGYAEDSAYCYFPYKVVDCFDCDFSFECQLCYQCLDCQKCYDCGFCQSCLLSKNLRFCYFCRDCEHCWSCVGLHHNKYCIYNQQFSKKDYFNQLKSLKKLPVQEHQQRLQRFSRQYPRRQAASLKSENSPFGNFITNCSNSYWVFDGVGDQDCGYLYQSKFCQDCFDCDQSYKGELLYQSGAGGFNYHCGFIDNCQFCRFSCFLENCDYCDHCFGCVNLQHAKYCILNQQYSKKDYLEKIQAIKKELGWYRLT